MPGIEEKTEALVLLLSGVSDRKLRAASLEGKLSGMGMEEIASILKIASLKPTSPRVLEDIFRSHKWIARYRVKKALVCNPYCPPSIAVHLLKLLLLSDLREITKFEDLHPAVKEAAHQLLAERCGKVD